LSIHEDSKEILGEEVLQQQHLIDHLEYNGMMTDKNQNWMLEINFNINNLIMLSFGLLYVGICPSATLIVFVYFAIGSKVD
jgi:hypothetical protein